MRFNPCLSSLFGLSGPERFFCVAIVPFAARVVHQNARFAVALGHFREEIIPDAAVRFFVHMVVAFVGAAGKVGNVAFSDETNGSEASSGERKAVR